MIHIRRRGDGVDPVMVCSICLHACALRDCWLVFHPLGPDHKSSEGQFAHRSCLDGHSQTAMQSQRVVMWRASDLLERLLRS